MVETYLVDLGRVRASGGATGERSSYPALANLLNAVGATLKPKVFCVVELADQGAGHPDMGLYSAKQLQKGGPEEGQTPEHGVVEVKSAEDNAWLTADGPQVSRYWGRYRLVLVTNTRDFVLVGEDASGRPAKLETFRLAGDGETFEHRLSKPRSFTHAVGAGLGEYLSRALSHSAALTEPKDLAWLLASYARDGLARVEAAGDAPSLEAVRSALEEALGVRFEGEKGTRFFHSALVQTLFYGIFSAWVLWTRAGAKSDVGPLFADVSSAARFDWRTAVWHLRAPVLRALFQQLSDPGRLQPLGLVEVLDWTAAVLDRVDRPAFFDRFNEGEAVPYFYEPFLEAFDPGLRKQLGVWYTPAEVVRYMVARVDKALKDDLGIADGLAAENVYVLDPCCGTGAFLAEVLRRIAANLQSQGLGALTGARVKQAATERVFGFEIMPAPFVRMAERRIAERTGRGIVCFISNYSWLDGLSFTGMRERYLEAFDAIRIDNLHGDRIISEYAPDGRTSETVFALRGQSPGIKVGASITLLSRSGTVAGTLTGGSILYRDFHHAKADERRRALLDSLDASDIDADYSAFEPNLRLGLPFKPMAVSKGWFAWPSLPDLFPVSFPGVKTSRDGFLVDTDLDRLKARVADYFDASLSHEDIARLYPGVMKSTSRFNAYKVRDALLARGGPNKSGFVRHAYRPFDNRWLYWEADTKLLDEKRADYRPHVFEGSLWLLEVPRLRRDAIEPQAVVTSHLASLHLIEWSASMFPAWLRNDGLGMDVEDLFHHVLATLHDPAYREANAGALRVGWPRIPLPGWPDGEAGGAAVALARSAAQGRELAALLDPETPVPGVTQGPLRPEIAAIAVPDTTDGRNMTADDFAVTAGWGHYGSAMP